MDSAEKLQRILGREDWQTLTPTQVAARARELEQEAAFARTLVNTLWKRKAPNVGAVLHLNGDAED